MIILYILGWILIGFGFAYLSYVISSGLDKHIAGSLVIVILTVLSGPFGMATFVVALTAKSVGSDFSNKKVFK